MQAKGLKPSFAWQDIVGEEHNVAFTVAKMMDVELLKTVQGKLEAALAEGKSLQAFKNELIPTLQGAGWWGKKDLVDPLTGQVVKAQLGSASRLETIFRTNLQSAYSVGHWDSIQRSARTAPYLMYDAVDDHRTRPEHDARDGEVHSVYSDFWKSHFPPNGWNCRCGVIQLDKEDLQELGLQVELDPNIKTRKWTNPRTGTVQDVPIDVDPGFDHNPGRARLEHLGGLMDEKALRLQAQQRKALERSLEKQRQAQVRYEKQLAQDKELLALQKKQDEASDAIAKALEENTPYLNSAIKKLKKTKMSEDMDSIAFLAKAREMALKEEQNALIQSFKKTSKKGKAPTAKAQAYFDSLPQELQAPILAEIEAAKASTQAQAKLATYLADADHPDAQLRKDAIDKFSIVDDIAKDPIKLLQAVDGEVKALKVQAAKVAKDTLETIAEGDYATAPALHKKVYAKLKKEGATIGQSASATLDLVLDTVKLEQAKKAKIDAMGAYKKAVVAGKIPSPNQQQIFNGLPDAEKTKILADIDKQKAKSAKSANSTPAAAAPEPEKVDQVADPDGDIDLDSLTQIGGQGGSNPGGLYQDTSTGQKWYIKQPKSEDIARNEVLTGKFYEAAGIEVPEMRIIDFQGKPSIASKIIDGLESDRALLTSKKGAPGAGEGFVMDAWLANWDVIGLGYDNLLVKAGRAIRVDTGAGLRYRAQGGQKGPAFGNVVGELETLRDSRQNGAAAGVFGNLTDDQLLEGARKVLAFTDDDIRDLVEKHGPRDRKTREELISTLIARREYIGDQFPEARVQPKAAPVVDTSDRVSRIEHENVVNSRSNGYSFATDRDEIEDQNVLIWQKRNKDGDLRTGGYLKIRGEAEEALRAELPAGGAVRPQGDYNDFHDKLVAAIKSIRYRLDKGEVDLGTAKEKIQAAADRYDVIVHKMIEEIDKGQRSQKDLDDFRSKAEAYIDQVKATLKNDRPVWNASLPNYKKWAIPLAKIEQQTGPGRQWTRTKASYTITDRDRGHVRERDEVYNLPNGDVFETEIDGARIRYWPSSDDIPQALRGRIEIDSPGGETASTAKIFELLDELGIDSSRATEADVELLYLQQLAYANKIDKQSPFQNAMAQRDIPKVKAWLSKRLDVDLETSPHYKPFGELQAFEHGRRTRYRPELLGSQEWPEFERDYRLIHRITNGSLENAVRDILAGGGQMAPSTDKIRRGIPLGGMSPGADLESGGANYFFTRLKRTHLANKSAGFVWNARVAVRMDAITYDGDKYGRTTGDFVRQNRKYTLDAMKRAAGNSSNETIIKDSLSLFDDLERIVAGSEAERKRIIKIFREAGYEEFPDGRALEDVIKSEGM